MNYLTLTLFAEDSIETINKTISDLNTCIKNFNADISDWSSRVYKKTDLTVTCWKTEGEKYSGLSVEGINEKRRDNRINGFKDMIEECKKRISMAYDLISTKEETIMAVSTIEENEDEDDDFAFLFADFN